MRLIAFVVLAFLVAGCAASVPPEVLQQYQGRPVYTCCNIHYESSDLTDANYYVGETLPLGTPVVVEKMTTRYVTIAAPQGKLSLYHDYGTGQESAPHYFAKVLVYEDPNVRLQSFPPGVQQSIRDGYVERGMTREQVIMALGYPPTHETASLDADEWKYWYSRFQTYLVGFGEDGRVASIIGVAPTANHPVE